MGVAVQVQAYASLAHPDYIPKAWHVFLVRLRQPQLQHSTANQHCQLLQITVLVASIYLSVNFFYSKLLHPMNLARESVNSY